MSQSLSPSVIHCTSRELAEKVGRTEVRLFAGQGITATAAIVETPAKGRNGEPFIDYVLTVTPAFTPTLHHFTCEKCRRVRVLSQEYIDNMHGDFAADEPRTYPDTCRSCESGVEIPAEAVTPQTMMAGVVLGIAVGQRVRLRRAVERFPHFIVEAGEVGTVSEIQPMLVSVKMDAFIDGCEEWDNEILWNADEVFTMLDDLEVIA